MRILVVGTDDWAVEQASATLAAAGHTALACHDPGTPAFPCNRFVPGRRCPLDDGVDVVVDVRARAVPDITPGEVGVVCALRDGVPLVVAGLAQATPFDGLAAVTVPPGGDLATACEDAAVVIDLRHHAAPAPR